MFDQLFVRSGCRAPPLSALALGGKKLPGPGYPKGVEHRASRYGPVAPAAVFLPLMPKSVEHYCRHESRYIGARVAVLTEVSASTARRLAPWTDDFNTPRSQFLSLPRLPGAG
jgi:hypothetical protein